MSKPFSALLLLAALAGCHGSDPAPSANPLAGSWRLTAQQVMVPNPLPHELLVFDNDQHFYILRNVQLAAQGTYRLSQEPSCGETTSRDQLRFDVGAPGGYAPSGAYTLRGDTLVIDQTNRCISDTGIYTYVRQR